MTIAIETNDLKRSYISTNGIIRQKKKEIIALNGVNLPSKPGNYLVAGSERCRENHYHAHLIHHSAAHFRYCPGFRPGCG